LGGGGFALYWFVLKKKPTAPVELASEVEAIPEAEAAPEAEAETNAENKPETSAEGE
jgi:hypothetical protein